MYRQLRQGRDVGGGHGQAHGHGLDQDVGHAVAVAVWQHPAADGEGMGGPVQRDDLFVGHGPVEAHPLGDTQTRGLLGQRLGVLARAHQVVAEIDALPGQKAQGVQHGVQALFGGEPGHGQKPPGRAGGRARGRAVKKRQVDAVVDRENGRAVWRELLQVRGIGLGAGDDKGGPADLFGQPLGALGPDVLGVAGEAHGRVGHEPGVHGHRRRRMGEMGVEMGRFAGTQGLVAQ